MLVYRLHCPGILLRERCDGRRDDEILQRTHEVSAEKCQLHQHRVEKIQRESFLEPGNQNVVEHRHEPPQEKQGGHDRERSAVGVVLIGGVARPGVG